MADQGHMTRDNRAAAPSSALRPPASRVMDRVLIAVFGALLLAPLVCQFAGFDLKGGAEDEKRQAAAFPKFALTGGGLRAFPRGFDAWFTDHFGLRRALIRLHSAVVYFGLGSSPVPKVIVGKEGWLYYNSIAGNDGSDSITDYRGTRPLTLAQLEGWRWTFQDEHDWCVANGIKFFLVLIPAKEAVYPEFTPDWMTRVSDRTALEQLTGYLREKAAFPWVDVSPALQEAKKRDRVFLLTDTHWSRFGAYAGWRAFLPMITNAFPAVTLPPDSDFTLSHEHFLGGDLTQIMSLRPVTREEYVMMKPGTPPRAKTEIAYGRELPDIVATTGDTRLPRAVVFRDSFTEDIMPFLSENFQRTAYSWARVGIEIGTIKRERPDLVIHIMADRMMRKGLRYPTRMRDHCCAQRFAAATHVMLAVESPRPVNRTALRRDGEAWVITAGKTAPRIELGPLAGDPSKLLPIVRLDITMPAQTDLHLVWRDSAGAEQDMRADLAAGRHEVFFPLTDPDIQGPLLLDPGHRPGDYILHAAEVRAIPR